MCSRLQGGNGPEVLTRGTWCSEGCEVQVGAILLDRVVHHVGRAKVKETCRMDAQSTRVDTPATDPNLAGCLRQSKKQEWSQAWKAVCDGMHEKTFAAGCKHQT